jgi:hypothetical protein
MRTLDWPALLEALSSVERLGPSASGLLTFGEVPAGGIFVEEGRICWAAAHGLERRLRDLLRRDVDGREIERAYRESTLEGRPFGQALVARGLIESRELERALRRHSAESLVKLCAGRSSTHWSARKGRGYSPRFTFPALDVLFDVVSLVLPEQRARALEELTPLLGPGREGASFLLDASLDRAVPLVAAFQQGPSVESLADLAALALSVTTATRQLAASPSFALVATARGDTVSVWWHESMLHAVICADRSALAAATAHHLARA